MNSPRRVPLLIVLAVALLVVGVVSSLTKKGDNSQLPSALALNGRAESTALYCTGFSNQKLGESGRVIFLNTTNQSHLVTIDDVSDTGDSTSKEVTLRAYQQFGFDPSAGMHGDYFGVGAQVSGGGVVGVQVARRHTSEAPCISTGVTNWFGAGFDTTVGSSAILSVYNPTATPAVFNVSTFSSSGYVAPAKFQGYAVGPHSQAEIHLGTEIVNTKDVGVHVRVLRGTLDIVGLQQSGPTVSFNTGVNNAATSAIFPLVTTANNATAQIRLSNPGPTPANVTLAVTLAPFHVPNQTLTVPPYGSTVASITPNPAIPAGIASVVMSSSQPVIAALATGTGNDVALSAPQSPESEFLVGDFTGSGFDNVTLTNTSSRSISVSVVSLPVSRSGQPRTAQVRLSANSSLALRSEFPTDPRLRGVDVIVAAPRPSLAALLVTATLPTRPVGMTVVSALDGR